VTSTTPSPYAVTIPVARYLDPGFATLENERLWPHVWQFACSLDHVAAPGDFYEYVCGHYSTLVVRDNDGVLRAFQNVCRHRGSQLCDGAGSGLEHIRCPFHRWTWDLTGRLREVPSRREFGVHNDDLPLIPCQVDTWGPLVFVNPSLDAERLDRFLEPVPADSAWVRIDEFHCTASATVPARCNWKTLIDAFSETYHVQGIHREMLPMCDDVNGPQGVWHRHGRLVQPYATASPRLRDRPDDQAVWEAFVEIMGNRVGLPTTRADAGPAPDVTSGGTFRDAVAHRIREHNRGLGIDLSDFDTDQMLNMSQYNLFPNITVLVFSDMLHVIRARPGRDHTEAFMDAFLFERRNPTIDAPTARPFDVVLDPDDEPPLGLVLNQDVANFERAQRGMRQPGLTHLTVSPTEECRLVNLHRNLEEYLGITPTELVGAEQLREP
jgi:phenylpropionate dioxygenase-like ring-hydroxylating dioxygenase large terminal subunit